MSLLRTWIRHNRQSWRNGSGYVTLWEVRAALYGYAGDFEAAHRVIDKHR